MNTEQLPLRLRFPFLNTGRIPVEHGEALYAALCRKVPALHHHLQVGISGISGTAILGNQLLVGKKSGFILQCPKEILPGVVRLSGSSLDIRGSRMQLGVPQIFPIVPTDTLIARFVTVRGKTTEQELHDYLTNYIQKLHETESNELSCNIRILRRRVMTIHGKRIVGFGVAITDILSPELSLAIQVHPPGGRRRYGASFFLPGTLLPVESDPEATEIMPEEGT